MGDPDSSSDNLLGSSTTSHSSEEDHSASLDASNKKRASRSAKKNNSFGIQRTFSHAAALFKLFRDKRNGPKYIKPSNHVYKRTTSCLLYRLMHPSHTR